jgi:hypothetical protein
MNIEESAIINVQRAWENVERRRWQAIDFDYHNTASPAILTLLSKTATKAGDDAEKVCNAATEAIKLNSLLEYAGVWQREGPIDAHVQDRIKGFLSSIKEIPVPPALLEFYNERKAQLEEML